MDLFYMQVMFALLMIANAAGILKTAAYNGSASLLPLLSRSKTSKKEL